MTREAYSAHRPTHTTIAGVWVDCLVSESYTLDAEHSDSPVERGADMTHHVRLAPEVLELSGIISSTPIEHPESHTDGATPVTEPFEGEGEPALLELPIVGGTVPGLDQANAIASNFGGDLSSLRKLSIDALRWSRPFDRIQAVKVALQTAVRAKQPVALVTGLHTFDAVGLSRLHFRRDESTGGALHFEVTARALNVVDSETVERPAPKAKRSQPTQSAGSTQGQTQNPDSVRRSGAAKLLGL